MSEDVRGSSIINREHLEITKSLQNNESYWSNPCDRLHICLPALGAFSIAPNFNSLCSIILSKIAYCVLPESHHVFKCFAPVNGAEELTCPALCTSWLAQHVWKLDSDTDRVTGFVFRTCNTYFRDLRFSWKGWVLWDFSTTVGRNSDSCGSNCWGFHKISMFLSFSEALHGGYEDGQNSLLYGLLKMPGFV